MQEQAFTILILIIVILAYLVLGALIFQQLESGNEQESYDKYYELFHQLQQRYNISMKLMEDVLDTHQKACELGLPNTEMKTWSFTGSFYFVGTVLTTIGKRKVL
jgi:Ion channel.